MKLSPLKSLIQYSFIPLSTDKGTLIKLGNLLVVYTLGLFLASNTLGERVYGSNNAFFADVPEQFTESLGRMFSYFLSQNTCLLSNFKNRVKVYKYCMYDDN